MPCIAAIERDGRRRPEVEGGARELDVSHQLASQHGSRSTLISDDHRLEGVRWKTQFNNRRRSPAREVRIVRMGAEPVQRRCLPSAGTSTSNHHNRSVSAAAGAPAEAFAPTLISFDNLGIRSVAILPRRRERDSRRHSPRTVRLVPVRTVPARINPQPIAVPVASTPMEPIAIGPEHPCPGPSRTTTAPQLEPGEHGANSDDVSRRREVPLTAKRASVEMTSISCCDAPTGWSGVGSARELGRKLNVSYAPKPRSR